MKLREPNDIRLVGEVCTGCTACQASCPVGAISMRCNAEGFSVAIVDEHKCTKCGLCLRVCPTQRVAAKSHGLVCYAARTKDNAMLKESTSGGIFGELAAAVLSRRGAVFGCVWDKVNHCAHHVKATDKEGVAAMQGAKYVQSEMGTCFIEVKKELDEGREVLFTGTPCQIAGLKAFLRKDYSSLLAVAIICHGTPSPNVFKKYYDELVHRYGSDLVRIKFRDKSRSWRSYCLFVEDVKGNSHSCEQDPFVTSFLRGWCNRRSCYKCNFREGRSGADMIIGDFWGIENVVPEFDDEKGVSAVICYTQKAIGSIDGLLLDKKNVRYEDISTKYNLNLDYDMPLPPNRKTFMRCYRRYERLADAMDRCVYGPWIKCIMRPVYHWLKRLAGIG